MRKISTILAAGLVFLGVACDNSDELKIESKSDLLSATRWVQIAKTWDGDDIDDPGYNFQFGADGTFDDPGQLLVEDGAGTYEWNDAETQLFIVEGEDTVAVLNILELSATAFNFDVFAAFPDISHDHFEFFTVPACSFNAADWKGQFEAVEDYDLSADFDTYGPYEVNFVQDAQNPNKFTFTDFWDSGLTAFILFDPTTGKVTFPEQTSGGASLSGSGSFDACTKSFRITTDYDGDVWHYYFVKK